MENISIKDSIGNDVMFRVVRQPSGTQSAILTAIISNTSPGGGQYNRTAYPKIEVSTRIQAGATSPTVSIVVPYGVFDANGVYKKIGQVATTTSAKQPADSSDRARADAAAFQKNLMASAVIQDLLTDGNL